MSKRKLTDICSIQYGCAFDASQFTTLPEEGMPLIRIRDVKDGCTNTYYKGDYSDEYIIHKGDYLVGMDGEFNIEPWQSEDALLNQRVCKIESKSEDVLMRYIYRFLKKELKRIEDDTPFVTVKHLSAKRLNQVLISVPPLPEQEKIVSELDCLSGIIEKKRQQLKELDALAQSIFYEMFGDPVGNEKGWEVERLGNKADISSSKRIFANEYTDSGIPFYRGKEVTEKSKGNPLSIELYISQERYDEIKSNYGVPEIGDILITAVGTIGNIWIVDTDEPFYFKDGNVLWLKVKDNTNPVYFKYILTILINEYKAMMANGCAYSALTIVNLKEMPTCVTPLPLQQSFAQKIEAIEQQKALIKQSIAEVETLFNARMQEYFE